MQGTSRGALGHTGQHSETRALTQALPGARFGALFFSLTAKKLVFPIVTSSLQRHRFSTISHTHSESYTYTSQHWLDAITQPITVNARNMNDKNLDATKAFKRLKSDNKRGKNADLSLIALIFI